MPEARPWVTIGWTTNETDRTGCTVLLFNRLSPAVVDVRGGAPGTRETALLEMGRMVGGADAIVLTGGSAFGLATCDGVMRFLHERGRGFPTNTIPVPIVPGAVIYDLGEGLASWPGSDDGYRAAASARPLSEVQSGRWGAGTGATVAKLGNRPSSGGIGIATVTVGETAVTAVVVLNAVGDIVDPATARPLASAGDAATSQPAGRDLVLSSAFTAHAGENTTIGTILIDGAVDRDALQRCCVAAHGALARCVVPSHTIFDGDTFFAVAREEGTTPPGETLVLASATEVAVEKAIVSIFGK
jgi:L-aminopeptidase/D-esterase-like protein